MASTPDRPKGKSLSDLNMVWRFAARYPGHIVCAGIALLAAAAATSGVPYAFKLIIDRGFSGGGDISRWFQYLLFLVIIMALATAVRFYFVSYDCSEKPHVHVEGNGGIAKFWLDPVGYFSSSRLSRRDLGRIQDIIEDNQAFLLQEFDAFCSNA